MKLKLLTLIAPKIQVSEIFPVSESDRRGIIISHQAINEVIAETK